MRDGFSPATSLISVWPFDYVIMMRKRRLLSASFFLVSEWKRRYAGPFHLGRGRLLLLCCLLYCWESVTFIKFRWAHFHCVSHLLVAHCLRRDDDSDVCVRNQPSAAAVQFRQPRLFWGIICHRYHLAFRGSLIADERFQPNRDNNVAVF